MAPLKKSKTPSKRFVAFNDFPSKLDGSASNKSKQKKKKLTGMLGPEWSRQELTHFYDAYRKYGKDWKKVAQGLHNRSVEMVEALYCMNRAYLSLPEGIASVAGLIAMVTDHYNVLEGSSDRGSDDSDTVPQNPQKYTKGKSQAAVSEDVLQSPVPSLYGGRCMKLLKMHLNASGIEPSIPTRKRTPRVPVSSLDDEYYLYNSPTNERAQFLKVNMEDDEFAHGIEKLSTEAQLKVRSPKHSPIPHGRMKHMKSLQSSVGEILKIQSKHGRYGIGEEVFINGMKLNGARNGNLASAINSSKAGSLAFLENRGKKREKHEVEGDDTEEFDNVVEDYNSADKAGGMGFFRRKRCYEAQNGSTVNFPVGKRNKKLFFEDDPPNFDALQTLVDLSLTLTPTAAETVESSRESVIGIEMKADSTAHSDATLRSEGAVRGYKRKRKSLIPKVKATGEEGSARDTIADSLGHSVTTFREVNPDRKYKRKCKPLASKKHDTEEQINPQPSKPIDIEVSVEGVTKFTNGTLQDRARISTLSEQCQLASSQDVSSSDGQSAKGADIAVSSVQVGMVAQGLPLRKGKCRRKAERALIHRYPQNGLTNWPKRCSTLPYGSAMPLKDKLTNCFSSRIFRRWCVFEWFYSAIDYPWFSQREFDQYLNHVGLGHIPRLTRIEWCVIKCSLGRPRRLSECFLLKERDKLEQYRESVRRHYAELRAGSGEGLPSDLARPLSVGQRVIAIDPKSKELHDGSILTIDVDKCRVQFDHANIGVELVKDIDCMPMNPVENAPEALRKHLLSSNFGNLNVPEISGGFLFPSIEHLEGVDACNSVPPPIPLLKNQAKVDARSSGFHAKVTSSGSSMTPSGTQTLPSSVVQIQSGESDNQTMLQPICLLERKVSLSQVKVEQPSIFSGDVPSWPQHITNSVEPSWTQCSSTNFLLSSQEPNLVEIIKFSREKAHGLVDTAVKALSLLKEGENAVVSIQEALSMTDVCEPATGSREAPVESPIQMASTIVEQQLSDENSGAKLCDEYKGKDPVIPSELITSCLAAYIMILRCTERQHPPADIAQLLDTAVKSLHPCCPQNLSIYRDIEMCMGRIKTQILALVPT